MKEIESVSEYWKGKRFILLARQSNDKEGAASTQAQVEGIKRDALLQGMVFVDQMVLEGVTGSLPGRREDLEAMLRRKRERDDFDVIVVQFIDRLTRGGAEHGFWFEHEAARHGLEVYFAGEDLPQGPYSGMVRFAKYDAAHEQARSIGRRSAQCKAWAQQQGSVRTTGQTPWGCWRMYFGANGQARSILRNLKDGRQEQLDPTTRQVIATYGTVAKKSRNRFKKQKNEYALLMPGDRQEQQAARVVFYLRYKRGWRGCRIADFLNRNGVPSPRGGTWSPRQVESVYENEAYTGVTYNNQTFSGRFYRICPEKGYEEVHRSKKDLATAKGFRPVPRPRDQWQRVDQFLMAAFLPDDVRRLAIAAQEAMWAQRLDETRMPRKWNAHPASEYLLSGVLTAVQDGETLIGTLSGPKGGPRVPYYRHRRAKRDWKKGSIYNHLIPAKPLHEELLRVLGEVLGDMPNLRKTLTDLLTEQRCRAEREEHSVAELEAERDDIRGRITVLTRTLSGSALKDVADDLERMGRRRNEIEAELKLRRQQIGALRPVEEVVEEAVACCLCLSRLLNHLPREPLIMTVREMVVSAKVDMETKDVVLELTMPDWSSALAGTSEPIPMPHDLCPLHNSRLSTVHETQALLDLKAGASSPLGVILAAYKCEYLHKVGSTKPVCYLCTRRPLPGHVKIS